MGSMRPLSENLGELTAHSESSSEVSHEGFENFRKFEDVQICSVKENTPSLAPSQPKLVSMLYDVGSNCLIELLESDHDKSELPVQGGNHSCGIPPQ